MKNLFVGIDISKDVLDYHVADENRQSVPELYGQIENSKKGIASLLKQIKKWSKDGSVWVCAEHTGHYGSLLTVTLAKTDICFSLVPPMEIKKSSGITRGKTDAVDAKRIAVYAATFTNKLRVFSLASETIRLLKVNIALREQLVKQNTATKNQLKVVQSESKFIGLKPQLALLKNRIKSLEKDINSLDKKINELIADDESLNETYNKIIKIPGVGPITASKCIVATENFTKFTDGRKFSCHCGIAPFKHQSGSSVKGKTRTSNLRNKALKGALFKAACSAIQHDREFKAYYKRKLLEKKPKLWIINAVANKIILRIFAVYKRNEPYVKLMN